MPRVEAVSFVNPKRVPQMAGAEEVMAAIDRRPGTVYAGLVLNERGYERALAAGVDEVHYAFPVTDEFARRNQNTTVAERRRDVRRARRPRAGGRRARSRSRSRSRSAARSRARSSPPTCSSLAERVAATGPDEIVLADTDRRRRAVAGPRRSSPARRRAGVPVGCHFHNTRNTGFANAVAAIEAGATVLDASLGGTGGCPFAPRATGNIATEDLVYLLHGMGHETGIDLDALIGHAVWLGEQLGKELPGQLHKAGTFAPVAG